MVTEASYYPGNVRYLTPKMKGIQRVTCMMSPWFEGNVFDVTLVRGQHQGYMYDVALV